MQTETETVPVTGKITGLDHVQLAMPHGGEQAARAFFCAVLGMTEIVPAGHLAVTGGCWFASGSAQIHLAVEEGFSPSRRAHPALLVDDLPTVIERLENHGVPFSPGKPLEGYIRGDIADPFGNRIELMQRV